MTREQSQGWWRPDAWLPALLIIGPYFLNKAIYIKYPGFLVFEVTDYACRIVSLAFLYFLLCGNPTPLPIPWRLAVPSAKELLIALLGTVALIGTNAAGMTLIRSLNAHSWRLTNFPAPSNTVLQYLDNTVGMVLVGLSEEAAFRFYLMNLMFLRGASPVSAVAASTLIFAAIHWSYGAGSTAFAAFAGLLLSIIFLAVRNLATPVIVHAAFDAFYFTGGVALLWRAFSHP